ncbi:MAG: RecX family transcriptional regulator [Holdemanella sp.]|nr:RecX family transcriptional regulator [Holdemanella sp.]
MRIGLFTDSYLPDINGVVSSVQTLKEALERQGHTVFIVTNHIGLKVVMEDDILRLPGFELKRFYGYKMSSPIQFTAIEYVTKMNLDIIHVQTEAGVGTFGRYMGYSLHIPVVYTYHTMYEDYTHYLNPLDINMVSSAEKTVIRTASRIWANSAAAVIAPSEKTKHALQEYGVLSPIYVVPTGLDLSEFDTNKLDKDKVKSIRSRLHLSEDDHVAVFVGRIAKEKAIDIPIRTLTKSEDKNLHLVIVGGGTDEGYYKQVTKECNLEDRVHFIGKVPKSEVAYYYAAFDCFVSASLSETQGMTYIEALASGLLIFGRRDEVLKDLIEEGKTGYYFDDEQELAYKFKQFFDRDKEERSNLRTVCIEKTALYRTDIFASKALAVYYQTIEDYKNSYVIDRIQTTDDFMKITVSRDCDGRIEKFLVPMDEYFERKMEIGHRLDAFMVDNYVESQRFYIALRVAKQKIYSGDYSSRQIWEYCRYTMNLEAESCDSIVQSLRDAKLISDRKYALEKAEYWQSIGKSKNDIIRKLQKVGISEEYIQLAVDSLNEETEMNNALKMAIHLKNKIKGQSSNVLRKTVINNLIQKGYSLEVAYKIGEAIEFESDEEDLLISFNKAKRLYSHFAEPKRTERIRIYCMRKGFTKEQINELLEGERNDL